MAGPEIFYLTSHGLQSRLHLKCVPFNTSSVNPFQCSPYALMSINCVLQSGAQSQLSLSFKFSDGVPVLNFRLHRLEFHKVNIMEIMALTMLASNIVILSL
jgi:hypothetical protein